MNAYHDLRRRVSFMVNELHAQNRDASGYSLMVSRDLWTAAIRDMPEVIHAQYYSTGGTSLLGFPVTVTDRENMLLMVHEVRG